MSKNFKKSKREEPEFEQKIVDLARVTRVMAGGKRMRFRATIVIGDKKSKVGVGVAKGADVTLAISKAVNVAKKNLILTPVINGTLPCDVYKKCGAAKVLLRAAKPGTGIIAGGAVRTVIELSGLHDVVGKIMGSKNKINNVQATIAALKDAGKMKERKKKLIQDQEDWQKSRENKESKEKAVIVKKVEKEEK